jgi:2,3,4,5-tetrahydropyridine-2-carboxylate N-succinyltransferase
MSIASGHGIATITSSGVVLDVWYPNPALTPLSGQPSAELTALAGNDEIRGVKREVVSVEIDT